MNLVYPFNFRTDGHCQKNGSISIGILVSDRKNTTIDTFYKIMRIEQPSQFMAEATSFFTAVERVPEYCNGKFSPHYGNGDRHVVICSDCRELIGLIGVKKGNDIFLRNGKNGNARTVEEIEKSIENVQDITDSYVIECRKIMGGGKNPAHYLCREAEGRLA